MMYTCPLTIPPVSRPVNLFLIFHLNVTTPPPLILSILIASNPITSYVPASPHLKTSCSNRFENSWLNLLVLKKPSIFKHWFLFIRSYQLPWYSVSCYFTQVVSLIHINGRFYIEYRLISSFCHTRALAAYMVLNGGINKSLVMPHSPANLYGHMPTRLPWY